MIDYGKELQKAYDDGYKDRDAEIVRCKDCKWYQEGVHLSPNKFCYRLKDNSGKRIGYNFADDDFCSHAERRTDE